jgi:hypothetical protein
MGVIRRGADVELLPAAEAMAMADQADPLEHLKCSIHRRWGCRRVDGPAAIDELRGCDVSVDAREHLEEDPPLGRPTEAARTESPAYLSPSV